MSGSVSGGYRLQTINGVLAMKFSAPAGELAAASAPPALMLGDAPNLVNALRMVRLTAGEGGVVFSVNTLDRSAEVSVTAEVEESGEATARCAELAELLARLPAEQMITVTAATTGIEVRAGRSRYRIAGSSLADLPAPPELAANAARFTLDREDVLRLLASTAYAASEQEMRYYLCGIYLHAASNALRAVATDTHRLARHDLPLPNGAAKAMPGGGVIVPSKATATLVKMLKRRAASDDVSIAVDSKLIRFTVGATTFVSKLIDGTFPDYERILPPAANNSVTCDRLELIGALQRVGAIIDKELKRAMRLAVLRWDRDDKGAFHIQLQHDAADDVVAAETVGEMRVGARISYLMQALEGFAGKRVRLDANADAALRATDPDDGAGLAVIMPCRLVDAGA